MASRRTRERATGSPCQKGLVLVNLFLLDLYASSSLFQASVLSIYWSSGGTYRRRTIPTGWRPRDVAPVPVPAAGVGVRDGDVRRVALVRGERRPLRAPRQPRVLLQVLARGRGGGRRRQQQAARAGRWRRRLDRPGRDAGDLRPGVRRRRGVLRRAGRRGRRARAAAQRRAHRPLPQAASRGPNFFFPITVGAQAHRHS
jgi:hypothetical protein